MSSLISEFVLFLRVRKAWWLLPLLLTLLIVGAIIFFGQSSIVSPFVYALL